MQEQEQGQSVEAARQARDHERDAQPRQRAAHRQRREPGHTGQDCARPIEASFRGKPLVATEDRPKVIDEGIRERCDSQKNHRGALFSADDEDRHGRHGEPVWQRGGGSKGQTYRDDALAVDRTTGKLARRPHPSAEIRSQCQERGDCRGEDEATKGPLSEDRPRSDDDEQPARAIERLRESLD
jgi:hypothetical protein